MTQLGSTKVLEPTPREEQAIRILKQRLHQRFPEVSADRIDSTVQVHYHRFDNSRIRDYVPIFVERNAREDLAKAAA